MSSICSISILLDASYVVENIHAILFCGHINGWRYLNYTQERGFTDTRLIRSDEAAEQIMLFMLQKPDRGPYVFARLNTEEDVMLWFYKEKNGLVDFHISDFGADCKKTENGRIDLSYYVPFFFKNM